MNAALFDFRAPCPQTKILIFQDILYYILHQQTLWEEKRKVSRQR